MTQHHTDNSCPAAASDTPRAKQSSSLGRTASNEPFAYEVKHTGKFRRVAKVKKAEAYLASQPYQTLSKFLRSSHPAAKVELTPKLLHAKVVKAMAVWTTDIITGGRNARWLGRQQCPICQGRPDYACHPAGECSIGGRELHLTMADIPCGTIMRSPTLTDLKRALMRWSRRQSFAFVGYVELGGTKAGERVLAGVSNPHAHLITYGHQCCVEMGRINWSMEHGNARGGEWLGDIAEVIDANAQLKAEYAAKHSGKEQHAHGVPMLPIVVKASHKAGVLAQLL